MKSSISEIAQNEIIRALSSESQAIAIYSAELAVLKFLGRSTEPYSSILEEERGHEGVMLAYLQRMSCAGPNLWSRAMNQVAGTVLGVCLAFLPRKLSDPVHVWAEEQAAQIYLQCVKAIRPLREHLPQGAAFELELLHAADQERGHARLFA